MVGSILVSNGGILISHPNKRYIGRSIYDINEESFNIENLESVITKGIEVSFYNKKSDGKREFVCLSPVNIGDTDKPWSLGIAVDRGVIMESSWQIYRIAILIGIIGIIVLVTLVSWLSIRISKPLVIISATISKLALGKIKIDGDNQKANINEIDQISNSLQALSANMLRMAEFATEIGKGNLDANYQLISNDDAIGNSLIEMQKNLKRAKEEETSRRKADEIQNWVNVGLALLNDILRKPDNDFKKHAYNVLKTLVEYIQANQGVLFLAHQNDDFYEDEESVEYRTVAAIAWGRRKKIEASYKMGESLVGRCIFEKETIYMTEIPSDYVNITSGLGHANPKVLLLIPMKIDEQMFGVIEIASFNELLPHQIDFIERASDIIALSFINKQEADKTALLLERTKRQASELVQKEEELKQNIEEIEANQEESRKYELEAQSLSTAINKLLLVIYFDVEKRINYVNDNFINLFAFKQQITGKTFKSLGLYKEGFSGLMDDEIWDLLQHSSNVKAIRNYNVNNRQIKLNEVYSPVFDTAGILRKVIWIAYEDKQDPQE